MRARPGAMADLDERLCPIYGRAILVWAPIQATPLAALLI